MQLLLVGVNYKRAALAEREPLSFDSPSRQQILSRLAQAPSIEELVMISTCNRTEIYAISPEPQLAREAIVQEICSQAGLLPQEWEALAYTFYNKFAATHLFEVAAGLDSMVLGENEILRQVKQALEDAREAQVCGQILNQLMRFAITAGKRVRSETRINEGCASLATLASRLLQNSLSANAQVLVLGAGQMASVLLQNLADTPFKITLANRSQAHAQELAAALPETAQPSLLELDQIEALLAEADAVVACTAAHDYLLTRQQLAQRCPLKPLLLIDMAVPRNIDPDTALLEQVNLYDMDRLQELIQLSLEQRSQYIEQAQSILAEEATRFLEWFHNRDLVPTIRSMYQMFEEIRQREVSRGLQKYRDELSSETSELIERITKAVTQKILHYPVVKLKTAAPADQNRYDQALSELFGLDAQDGIDRYLHLPPVRQTAHQHPGAK